MRSQDIQEIALYSYISPEQRVPADHPLRPIREMANMEQLDYNVLYRWFVGLNMDDAIWDVTVFTKNRERFLNGDIAEKFFGAVLEQARAAGYLSEDHFTVDGTLIE